jgi:hypothetical protein
MLTESPAPSREQADRAHYGITRVLVKVPDVHFFFEEIDGFVFLGCDTCSSPKLVLCENPEI